MNIVVGIVVMVLVIGWSVYSAWQNRPLVSNQDSVKDPDQGVIDNLIKHGSNPEKEHNIEFVFYGEQSSVDKLKEEMISQNYWYDADQSVKDEGSSDHWLIMIKPYKLHINELKTEFRKMNELANRYSVTFDGWSAAIVR